MKHQESKDQKNSKAKKNYLPTVNSNSKNSNQYNQTLSQFSRKDFCVNKKNQQNQFSTIAAIGNNAIRIKKDKKSSNRDISQVKYYSTLRRVTTSANTKTKGKKSRTSLRNVRVND